MIEEKEMRNYTDDECVQIALAAKKGNDLIELRAMAVPRERMAESKEKQKQQMVENLARLKVSVFGKAKRRQEKYEKIVQQHPGLSEGTALKQIFDKEKIVQGNLGLLVKSWNGKKRKPNAESFALLHDLERFLKEPFMENSGYAQEAV
jgi:hypothetical protein